jgi:hypothetical protein
LLRPNAWLTALEESTALVGIVAAVVAAPDDALFVEPLEQATRAGVGDIVLFAQLARRRQRFVDVPAFRRDELLDGLLQASDAAVEGGS